MKIDLYNQSGEVIGKVDLPDKIFKVVADHNIVHQAVVAQAANSRQKLAYAKDRSEIRGGGTKPWRQKGTGRARHGSIRSPIWIGGGATFGPRPEKNYSKKINKKTKRKALFMALSSKLKDGQLMVVDGIVMDKPKTKEAQTVADVLSAKLKDYKKSRIKRDSMLFVTPGQDSNIARAFGNVPFAKLLGAKSLNVGDLLKYKYLLMLKKAIPVIEKHYKM